MILGPLGSYEHYFETLSLVFELEYEMNSNILSINHNVIVSDPSFIRLNNWLESKGFDVEKVSFNEISKQEGLFRCTSLPLIRN